MHIEMIIHAPPEKHKEIIQKLNDWKYPVEGKARKGYNRPLVSELRVYDIRIKEEVAGRFLRDMKAITFDKNEVFLTEEKLFQGIGVLNFFIRMFRRFTPFKSVKLAEGEREFSIPKWYNCYFIGAVKDPKQKIPKIEESEEVL